MLHLIEFTQGLELEPGNYELEISADGYETLRKVVELGAGEEKHLSSSRLTALRASSPLKPEPTAKIEAPRRRHLPTASA